MSTVQTEQVLVVKTDLFHDLGYFQGFSDQPEKYLPTLLDPANTEYLPRDQMEQDPSYKQLIPYCIFQHTNEAGKSQLFSYTRGSGAGESRLRSLGSIGIGGHISTLDVGDHSPYDVGMQRELDEEVEIGAPFRQSQVGMINDDSNDVGKVHLGVVHLFQLEQPSIRSLEEDIAESGFSPVNDLLRQLDRFETWSQICLKSLFANR